MKKFLSTFRADSPLLPNDFGHIVKVTEKSTLPEIFKILIENKIQSVPVVEGKTNRALFIVSMMDILKHFIDHFSEEEFKNSDIYILTLKEELQAHSKVQEAAHLAISVPSSVDLSQIVEAMVEHKVHRVLVHDQNGELINIITQSRVLKVLSAVFDSSPIAKKTLRELNLGFKEVISINEKATTLQGFKLIKEKKVYGIAVVNDKGSLVGVLSASDLKLIGYNVNYFKFFGEYLRDYLARIQASESASDSIPPIVKCHENETLGNVVRLIVFYRLHRLFIVDHESKPIGVVSLIDILEKIIQE